MRAGQVLEQIQKEHADSVARVFIHRPLPMHEQATFAAISMQAAARQGKAIELYEVMLINRKKLERADVVGYASELGIDTAKLEADLDDPAIAAEVEADIKLATEIGANSTPITYVNGIGVRGAKPKELFSKLVSEEIAEADKLLSAGTAIADIYDERCKANVKAGPRKA